MGPVFLYFFQKFPNFSFSHGCRKGEAVGELFKIAAKNILCFEWEKFSLLLATPTNIFEKFPSDFSLGKILLTSMVLRLCLRLHVLCLLCFYQACCTPVVRYCHVIGGGQVRFQLWRSPGSSKPLPYCFNLRNHWHARIGEIFCRGQQFHLISVFSLSKAKIGYGCLYTAK